MLTESFCVNHKSNEIVHIILHFIEHLLVAQHNYCPLLQATEQLRMKSQRVKVQIKKTFLAP